MSFLVVNKRNHYAVLATIIILSGFTHLWNPVGFPDIFFDEGVYMRRAMNVIDGHNPQEAFFYDHPFFGQIFLGGALQLINYPSSLNPEPEVESIKSLYLVPRIFVGLLAVLDTFLIYKITEKRFGTKIAIIASILFAVMPITWIFRRILLDTLLLPFLLLSIWSAMHAGESRHLRTVQLLSGVALGLAIFTKIPVFTMIPLIAYLIYSNKKSLKDVGLWMIPVILIPLIWPAYSIAVDQFDLWQGDVLWQSQRSSGGLPVMAGHFLSIDPVLFVFGLAGLVFAAIRKNLFILFWIAPFLIFLSIIGFSQYFHWIPVLPAFCIAASFMIVELAKKIKRKKLQKIIPVFWIVVIGSFGFLSTVALISTDMSSAQFEAASFILQNNINGQNTTILAGPAYSWIFNDVFHMENVLLDYSQILFEPIKTDNILLVADPHFFLEQKRGAQLQLAYDVTNTTKQFTGNVGNYDTSKYPYHSLNYNREGEVIEIRKGSARSLQ